jgi:hypothetical protein
VVVYWKNKTSEKNSLQPEIAFCGCDAIGYIFVTVEKKYLKYWFIK